MRNQASLGLIPLSLLPSSLLSALPSLLSLPCRRPLLLGHRPLPSQAAGHSSQATAAAISQAAIQHATAAPNPPDRPPADPAAVGIIRRVT